MTLSIYEVPFIGEKPHIVDGEYDHKSVCHSRRGISQERLPIDVGFFQFVHIVRLRGKTLFQALAEAFVCINPAPE